MSDPHASLDQLYKAALARIHSLQASGRFDDGDAKIVQIADQLRRSGQTNRALDLLSPLEPYLHGDAYSQFILALTYRDAQRMEAAFKAIRQAATLAPKQPDIAFARAQFAYETWRPAVKWFKQAQRLAPQNLAVAKNLALALVAEGRAANALTLLSKVLIEHPDWIEGHQQYASISATTGNDALDKSLEAACADLPDNAQLRLAWFQVHAQRKDWETAARILGEASNKIAESGMFKSAHTYLRAESGDDLTVEELRAAHLARPDPGLDLCRVRYCLRKSQPQRAEEIAKHYIDKPEQRLFWPYLSLCWRLTGSDKFDWLERGGSLIGAINITDEEFDTVTLAETLRSLHTLKQPYIEQSVRGGTQTERNLFFNPAPQIQGLRSRIERALKTHISKLPTVEPDHPFLGAKPQSVQYSGAWSVSLKQQGYHATHTHVLGWLSSALYISIPAEEGLGPPPAGYLSFGRPPPELGLDLQPYRQIKPEPGKLVLFPSYVWHGTEPFQSGERLTVAFDAVPAR